MKLSRFYCIFFTLGKRESVIVQYIEILIFTFSSVFVMSYFISNFNYNCIKIFNNLIIINL
jgi:hypothetical protein